MRSSMDVIRDFLAQKRIAMIGVSRNENSFSAHLFKDLCRRGYDVVPVNPYATKIDGRGCFARVQDIQPPVEGALLMTSPETTEVVVRDCVTAGIQRVWMYRGTKQGAVSEAAITFCQERGMQIVPGECPWMFLPKGDKVHYLHGLVRKITLRYPRRTAA
jgi:uncharacterized protein